MEKEGIRDSYYLDSYVARDVINSWRDSRSGQLSNTPPLKNGHLNPVTCHR